MFNFYFALGGLGFMKIINLLLSMTTVFVANMDVSASIDIPFLDFSRLEERGMNEGFPSVGVRALEPDNAFGSVRATSDFQDGNVCGGFPSVGVRALEPDNAFGSVRATSDFQEGNASGNYHSGLESDNQSNVVRSPIQQSTQSNVVGNRIRRKTVKGGVHLTGMNDQNQSNVVGNRTRRKTVKGSVHLTGMNDRSQLKTFFLKLLTKNNSL
jgi:hypothetical protein